MTETIPARSDWRRQAPAWIGLIAIVAITWTWLVRAGSAMSAVAGVPGMPAMSGAVDMAEMAAGSVAGAMPGIGAAAAAANIGGVFAMWSVMMVAMMLPTALPAISLFLGLSARRNPRAHSTSLAMIYAAGYLMVWLGFAAAAALAQVMLAKGMLLGPSLAVVSAPLEVAVLLGAGIYQLTPLKSSCLRRCRSPLAYFLGHWRDGFGGAVSLGLRGGAWCVGCCWALMAVLFVTGVMNVAWMAVLSALLLLEKVVPARTHLTVVSGVVLIGLALALAVRSLYS